MQATQQTVNYVPTSQKEWRVLLKYIGANRAAIELRKTAEYFAETRACAVILSNHFEINPPQRIVRVCPWETLGVAAAVEVIANKYSVPRYMTTQDVHGAVSFTNCRE